MKKLVSILASLLLAGVSFCQQEFFFNVYEDTDKSLLVDAAIEAHNGGFIFAQHTENYDSKCELVKLSDEGIPLKRVVMDPFPSSSYNKSIILGIFHDPKNPELYLALGLNVDVPNLYTRPFIVRFDEEIDITFSKEVDLPEQYEFYSLCHMTRDNKFILAFDSCIEQRRIYVSISTEGDVEKLKESTQDACRNGTPLYLGTLFEYPEGDKYGHFGESFFQPPSPMLTTRLFTLDENFDSISSKEFTDIFVDTIGSTIYSFGLRPTQFSTVKPLDDTTLLFYDRIREMKTSPSGSTQHEHSTVLFKTNLEGNMLDYRIIGSWNDRYDLPAELQSFDFAKNHFTSEKLFYTCHMELYDNYYFYYTEPNSIVVTKMDENLEVVWQRHYSIPSYPLRAHYVLATHDGGCLVLGSGHKNAHYDVFALKIDSDGSVGMEDILICPFMFYPNPVQDQLHMHYSPDATPTKIKLYDLQGRLVRIQSKDLDKVNMHGLAAGQYLMKVTMADGKVYSDMVIKD